MSPAGAGALAHATPAHADSWAAPQVTETFSASGDHFVRVTPGKGIGYCENHAGKQRCRNSNADDSWHSGVAIITADRNERAA
jgi:hypothetical protein